MKRYTFLQIFIFDDNSAYVSFHNTVTDEHVSLQRKISLEHARYLLNGKKWEVKRGSDCTIFTKENS